MYIYSNMQWEEFIISIISDADRGNTNVLCCPLQSPEASGAAPGPWGGHQQGTALSNVKMYAVEPAHLKQACG